jgi:host factor-I protein
MPFSSRPVRSAKPVPDPETGAEATELKRLGEKQTPVTIKLKDGQIVEGWIEYYDKNMLRLTRKSVPNLFIFKHEILYIAHSE